MMTPPPTCSTCRHFLPSRGQCRRYPPGWDGTFPAVRPDDWCGEHEESTPPAGGNPEPDR